MPPWVTGRRSSVRRTVTSVVSRIGTASTSSGSTTLVSVPAAVVQLEASASEASAEADHLAAGVPHEDDGASGPGAG